MIDEKITIGVVGMGFVGGSVARGFNLYAEIKTYDIDPKRCSHSYEEVLGCDFVFLCLPTPMVSAEGGEADLSIIENFFKGADDYLDGKKRPIFIIKSTVPIGTTDSLNKQYRNLPIVHSPEFLTARTANIDFITPARNLVGGQAKEDPHAAKVVELFKYRFPGVPCYQMLSNETEMVKYAANCFFATKVLFFNEMKKISEKLNIDWDSMLEGLLSDGRIAHSHTQVPGHDGDYGIGGQCVPPSARVKINYKNSYKDIDSRNDAQLDQELECSISDLFYIFNKDKNADIEIESFSFSIKEGSYGDYKKLLDVTQRHFCGDMLEFELDDDKEENPRIFQCTPDHLMLVKREENWIIIPALLVDKEKDEIMIKE